MKYGEEDRIYAMNHSFDEFAEKYNITPATARTMYSMMGVRQNPKFKKNRIKITEEEFKKYAPEHNVFECAEYFKVHRMTIYNYEKLYNCRCYKNKLSRPSEKQMLKRTGEAQDMIRTLIPVYTDAAIARVFGYSKTRIKAIRKEMEQDK